MRQNARRRSHMQSRGTEWQKRASVVCIVRRIRSVAAAQKSTLAYPPAPVITRVAGKREPTTEETPAPPRAVAWKAALHVKVVAMSRRLVTKHGNFGNAIIVAARRAASVVPVP